jgi:hypothetical protein
VAVPFLDCPIQATHVQRQNGAAILGEKINSNVPMNLSNRNIAPRLGRKPSVEQEAQSHEEGNQERPDNHAVVKTRNGHGGNLDKMDASIFALSPGSQQFAIRVAGYSCSVMTFSYLIFALPFATVKQQP